MQGRLHAIGSQGGPGQLPACLFSVARLRALDSVMSRVNVGERQRLHAGRVGRLGKCAVIDWTGSGRGHMQVVWRPCVQAPHHDLRAKRGGPRSEPANTGIAWPYLWPLVLVGHGLLVPFLPVACRPERSRQSRATWLLVPCYSPQSVQVCLVPWDFAFAVPACLASSCTGSASPVLSCPGRVIAGRGGRQEHQERNNSKCLPP